MDEKAREKRDVGAGEGGLGGDEAGEVEGGWRVGGDGEGAGGVDKGHDEQLMFAVGGALEKGRNERKSTKERYKRGKIRN